MTTGPWRRRGSSSRERVLKQLRERVSFSKQVPLSERPVLVGSGSLPLSPQVSFFPVSLGFVSSTQYLSSVSELLFLPRNISLSQGFSVSISVSLSISALF